MKKCITCGQEFEPKNPKGLFCSPGCRQKDYRARVKGWVKYARLAKGDFSQFAKSDPNATYVPVNWNTPKEVADVLRKLPEKQFQAEYNQEPEPPKRTKQDIWDEIAAIKKEKVPPERDTPNGRKYWQFEQNKRIKELEDKLKDM